MKIISYQVNKSYVQIIRIDGPEVIHCNLLKHKAIIHPNNPIILKPENYIPLLMSQCALMKTKSISISPMNSLTFEIFGTTLIPPASI